MNIKLLQTRLNSLDHYQSEIDKLQEALRLTQSTRQDILKSMVEFCDLTEGDLFIADGTFYKFISVDHSYEDGSNEKRISLKIKVETQVAKYHVGSY